MIQGCSIERLALALLLANPAHEFRNLISIPVLGFHRCGKLVDVHA